MPAGLGGKKMPVNRQLPANLADRSVKDNECNTRRNSCRLFLINNKMFKIGYYRKLGDPSVYTGCCLFTLGQYRYESTWYSIVHCCVPHSTK